MKSDLSNYPCECGHEMSAHNLPGGKVAQSYLYKEGSCLQREESPKVPEYCSCEKYKADNFKYMQQNYKEPKNER